MTTVLTGIGFAAVLFGFLSLTRRNITMRQGVLSGSRAFVCFHLAPSFRITAAPSWRARFRCTAAPVVVAVGRVEHRGRIVAVHGKNPDAQNRWRACRCHATSHRCAGWRGRQRRARRVDAELHYRVTRRCRDLLDGIGRYWRIPGGTKRTLTESLRFGVNDPPQVEKIGAPIVCRS